MSFRGLSPWFNGSATRGLPFPRLCFIRDRRTPCGGFRVPRQPTYVQLQTKMKKTPKTQKQNVFDDFIAAAEYLIAEGYTSKEKLAVSGRSNGGLLVGAVTTQRPDLFQVSLPGVGVLDMLRYHTFTAGAGWAYDYGTSEESEEMFRYLLGYSPLHNTKPGTAYPATLITTAERDDRVVPAHSYKFAAQMQYDHTGDAPVLIRIDSNAGHGAGTPTDKLVDQYADIYSFTLKNMGVEKIRGSESAL